MFTMEASESHTRAESKLGIVISWAGAQLCCRHPRKLKGGVETILINDDQNVVVNEFSSTTFTAERPFQAIYIFPTKFSISIEGKV